MIRGNVPRRVSVAGFTLAELLVAIVFLTLVGVAFGAVTQQAAHITKRSRTELGAQQFLEVEAEHLRLLAYDSLRDGSRTRGVGTAAWRVVDSTSFRQVLLETRYGSASGGFVRDSVTVFRTR